MGMILLIAGIISIAVAAPAFLLIALGLIILASEFVTVRPLIEKFSRKIKYRYCSSKDSKISMNLHKFLSKLEAHISKLSAKDE